MRLPWTAIAAAKRCVFDDRAFGEPSIGGIVMTKNLVFFRLPQCLGGAPQRPYDHCDRRAGNADPAHVG